MIVKYLYLFFYFIVANIFIILVPGKFLLDQGKTKLPWEKQFLLSEVLGLVFFTLAIFLLKLFHLPVYFYLIFVIFFSIFLFNEEITYSILFGGALILSSVFILSTKDKSEKFEVKRSLKEKISEDLIIGVLLAIGTAFFWAVAYVSLNQARILTGDIFISNFLYSNDSKSMR